MLNQNDHARPRGAEPYLHPIAHDELLKRPFAWIQFAPPRQKTVRQQVDAIAPEPTNAGDNSQGSFDVDQLVNEVLKKDQQAMRPRSKQSAAPLVLVPFDPAEFQEDPQKEAWQDAFDFDQVDSARAPLEEDSDDLSDEQDDALPDHMMPTPMPVPVEMMYTTQKPKYRGWLNALLILVFLIGTLLVLWTTGILNDLWMEYQARYGNPLIRNNMVQVIPRPAIDVDMVQLPTQTQEHADLGVIEQRPDTGTSPVPTETIKPTEKPIPSEKPSDPIEPGNAING